MACRRNGTVDHERLLTGWYSERKQQLEKSLASTVRNGAMVSSRNPVQIFIRDWALWFIQLIPSLKHWLELGPRSEGPVRYTHSAEMPFIPDLHGGISFPQTYCAVLQEGSLVQFTDDVIFGDGKKKLFQIVVLLSCLDELGHASNEIDGIDRVSDELSPEEATFFVPRMSLLDISAKKGPCGNFNSRLFRTATDDEFAESNLCLKRPPPRGYNETLMWQSVSGARYVILRSDRFVFAACNTRLELEQAARKLAGFFLPASR